MSQDRPPENIWYYLKRDAYKIAGDARELTSPLSIFADEIEGGPSSYLGGGSQFSDTQSNQYSSVYSDQKSTSIYSANNLYTANLTNMNTPSEASYLKDSFWKDDLNSNSSFPTSAGYLADSNSTTVTSDIVSSYTNGYGVRLEAGGSVTSPPSVSSIKSPTASYSSYIEAFSEHNQNLNGSGGSATSVSGLSSSVGSNSSGLGVSSGVSGSYSSYQTPYDQAYNNVKSGGADQHYLNQPGGSPPNTAVSSPQMNTSVDSTGSGKSNTSTGSNSTVAKIIDNRIELTNKSTLPWNESFQELLDRPVNSLEEEKMRNMSISNFSQHLANTATDYVKTLVQEVHMPPELKSIKPFEAGGFAGGEKFRIDNMFIKFALNPHQIYERANPVSYFANKAAGHELKSINALVSCGVPNLHFPLMCLLNYRGFRLIVISELPISAKTLVFGSSNAGETIHKNDTVLKMMVKIGEILNLKQHLVEANRFSISRTSEQYTIPLAIDIEGHFGFDGRYYVVDTARLFPPEIPIPGMTGCHLYRLFRPEFVKKYETQLCSDSFANFNVVDQDPFNQEATKANNHLILEYIPAFVKQRFMHTEVRGKTLKEVLHKDGVNLRYLGVMLYHIIKEKEDFGNSMYLQGLLAVEMLARTMRFIVFTEMRQINSPEDEPHLSIVVNHLNKLLVHESVQSTSKYWRVFLTNSLIGKYSYTCTTIPEVEKEVAEVFRSTMGLATIINYVPSVVPSNSPFSSVAYYNVKKTSLRYKLLKKFAILTGLVIDGTVMESYKDPNATPRPIQIADIKQINITVKHMRVSSSFKTFGNYTEAETYYKTELEFKTNQLGKDHTQVALTHIHLAELYETYSNLLGAQRHYNEAISIYQARFGIDDNGAATIKEKLALCLIKQKNYSEASKLLESVLKVKIQIFKDNSIEVADTYDNLAWSLQSQGLFEQSYKYYNRALEIKSSKGTANNVLSVAKTLNNLGHLLLSNNDLDRSLAIFCKVEDMIAKQYGRNNADVAVALDNIGVVYAKKKNYSMSERYFKECIDVRTKQFGQDSRYVALTMDHLAQLYLSWGKTKYSEASRLFEKCIEIGDRFPDHYLKAFLRFNYSKLYKKKRDKNKEKDYLNEALQIFVINNINTDLTTKIRRRLEHLSKSTFEHFKGFFSSPTIPKMSSGQPDIQISQHISGHMEMNSSNVNSSRNDDIPQEWQSILSEAGLSAEDWKDPAYAAMIQDFIKQESGRQIEIESEDLKKKRSLTNKIVTTKNSTASNSNSSFRKSSSSQEYSSPTTPPTPTSVTSPTTPTGDRKGLTDMVKESTSSFKTKIIDSSRNMIAMAKAPAGGSAPSKSGPPSPPNTSPNSTLRRDGITSSAETPDLKLKKPSTRLSGSLGSAAGSSITNSPPPPPALPLPIFSPADQFAKLDILSDAPSSPITSSTSSTTSSKGGAPPMSSSGDERRHVQNRTMDVKDLEKKIEKVGARKVDLKSQKEKEKSSRVSESESEEDDHDDDDLDVEEPRMRSEPPQTKSKQEQQAPAPIQQQQPQQVSAPLYLSSQPAPPAGAPIYKPAPTPITAPLYLSSQAAPPRPQSTFLKQPVWVTQPVGRPAVPIPPPGARPPQALGAPAPPPPTQQQLYPYPPAPSQSTTVHPSYYQPPAPQYPAPNYYFQNNNNNNNAPLYPQQPRQAPPPQPQSAPQPPPRPFYAPPTSYGGYVPPPSNYQFQHQSHAAYASPIQYQQHPPYGAVHQQQPPPYRAIPQQQQPPPQPIYQQQQPQPQPQPIYQQQPPPYGVVPQQQQQQPLYLQQPQQYQQVQSKPQPKLYPTLSSGSLSSFSTSNFGSPSQQQQQPKPLPLPPNYQAFNQPLQYNQYNQNFAGQYAPGAPTGVAYNFNEPPPPPPIMFQETRPTRGEGGMIEIENDEDYFADEVNEQQPQQSPSATPGFSWKSLPSVPSVDKGRIVEMLKKIKQQQGGSTKK